MTLLERCRLAIEECPRTASEVALTLNITGKAASDTLSKLLKRGLVRVAEEPAIELDARGVRHNKQVYELLPVEEDDEDPPCECVRIDVDLDDNRDCPLHGPHGPLTQYQRQQEANAEAASAAKIPWYLGEDWDDNTSIEGETGRTDGRGLHRP